MARSHQVLRESHRGRQAPTVGQRRLRLRPPAGAHASPFRSNPAPRRQLRRGRAAALPDRAPLCGPGRDRPSAVHRQVGERLDPGESSACRPSSQPRSKARCSCERPAPSPVPRRWRSRISRAWRFARHPRDGSPSVSKAASMRPPRRPRFFRKCIFCWARVVGSDSSQNRCPAYVVGTMEPIRASAASRRYFPTARRTPAPICTAPLIRTSVFASSWSTPTLSLRG